jgi:2-C-methyl-D-erythritol 2,4-cyclodiphosphate synthase
MIVFLTQASPLQKGVTMPDPFRIGHGYDIHRLQTGGELVLGGVVVADGISAIAHSDGDVVIHALVDALLGALGKGDIGEHFPNTEPAYQNAPSIFFLGPAMNLVRGAGFRVVNADITILAERPKLKSFKPKMVNFLTTAMDGAAVNVKAGTNESCDAIGRGEAIAAHAIVLLGSTN